MAGTRQLTTLILLGMWAGAGSGEEYRIEPALLSVIDESQVAAEEAGVVVEVSVEVGQQVTAGTRLAQLDDRDAQLELDRARLEYDRAVQAANDVDVRYAKEALALAELDLQRARDAVDRYAKSVSGAQIDRLEVMAARARLDVERAERDAEAARLAVQAALNGVKIAERGMERRQIRAPIDSTVVTADVRRGESVDAGKPVFRLVNTSRLRAEAFVDFRRLAQDLQAREVSFQTDLPQETSARFRGRVTFVSPEVNRVNGQVRVWAEIDNSQQRVRPGIAGTLIIHDRGIAEEPPVPDAAFSETPSD